MGRRPATEGLSRRQVHAGVGPVGAPPASPARAPPPWASSGLVGSRSTRCHRRAQIGSDGLPDACPPVNRYVMPACLCFHLCKRCNNSRRKSTQFSVRGALLLQVMEVTRLCFGWKSEMGKTFSFFVKIPIHAVEDLFPIREGLALEHGEGVQRGPGSVGEDRRARMRRADGLRNEPRGRSGRRADGMRWRDR